MLKNRIVIVIITAILAIFTARGIYHFVTATILDDINNTKNEQEIIKGQQEEAVRKYNELEAEISIYEREIAKVEEDIKEYEQKITNLSEKMESTAKEVASLEEKLQNVSLNYESTRDLLNTRLRALYENGFVNFWEIFITSTSITDFIAKYNVLVDLINYDKTALIAMQNEKQYISKLKSDAELKQTQVEQAEYDIKKSKETLELLAEGKKKALSSLEDSKAELKTLQDLLEERYQANEKELEELYKEAAAMNQGGFSGYFGWPIESSSLLTTAFNEWYCPFGVWRQHVTGVDLARSPYYTTEIYAAGDGIVTSVGYGSSAGNYVFINHGKSYVDGATYISNYYHLKSYCVKAGDYVTKGQLIGIMGTTGSSTGVHLHLGLTRDGVYVNPLDYLPHEKQGDWYYAKD